jgi:hypothetical protein
LAGGRCLAWQYCMLPGLVDSLLACPAGVILA